MGILFDRSNFFNSVNIVREANEDDKNQKKNKIIDATKEDDVSTDYTEYIDTDDGVDGYTVDDEPTDYTSDDNNSDTPDSEPTDYTSDTNTDDGDDGYTIDDEPTDYTSDDGESDDSDDDSDSQDEDQSDNEPTDYTTETGDADDSDNQNDQQSDDISRQDENQTEDDIKNKGLIDDMVAVYYSIKTTNSKLDNHSSVDIVANRIIVQVKKNLSELQTAIYDYILNKFKSNQYSKNLYVYTSFIEAYKINIEMLRKLEVL